MKKIFLIFILFLGLSFSVLVKAEDMEIINTQDTGVVTISPHIINAKAEARDILKYELSFTNNTDHKQVLYPLLNDLTKDGGREDYKGPADLDKATSLARWIRIRRGSLELMPGETKTEKLEIDVNSLAKPGDYYASIIFSPGTNINIAKENKFKKDSTQVLINITVEEKIVEKLQLSKYRSSKNVYLKFPIQFNFKIDNFGNRDMAPSGSIYIYDRRDKEVTELKVNKDGEKIKVGENKEYNIPWSPQRAFGKFKARIELEYGNVSRRDISDTIYFWVIPLYFLIIFFIILFFIILFSSIILFKKTYKHHSHLNHYQSNNNLTRNGDGVLNLKK